MFFKICLATLTGGIREASEIPADDDSQQAAEAMVQLGNVGFYVGEQPMLQQGNFVI